MNENTVLTESYSLIVRPEGRMWRALIEFEDEDLDHKFHLWEIMEYRWSGSSPTVVFRNRAKAMAKAMERYGQFVIQMLDHEMTAITTQANTSVFRG